MDMEPGSTARRFSTQVSDWDIRDMAMDMDPAMAAITTQVRGSESRSGLAPVIAVTTAGRIGMRAMAIRGIGAEVTVESIIQEPWDTGGHTMPDRATGAATIPWPDTAGCMGIAIDREENESARALSRKGRGLARGAWRVIQARRRLMAFFSRLAMRS